MKHIILVILYVIPVIVTSSTVSPNGHSPQIKMFRGMMVDIEKEKIGMTHRPMESTTKSNINRSTKLNFDSKLPLNERYRRLIPYMTFYYANDLSSTTQEPYSARDIEVERAEIVEAQSITQRQPKRIIYHQHRNIPRYQGNRLSYFNLASANPVKVYYTTEVPIYQNSAKVTPNLNPFNPSYGPLRNHDYGRDRFIQGHVVKVPSVPFAPTTTRKPFLDEPSITDPGDVQYFLSDQQAKFKLVPYEQSAPLSIPPQNVGSSYNNQRPSAVSVQIPREQVYIKPRPLRPQYEYDTVNIQHFNVRKVPSVVSESYYEKQLPLIESSTQQPLPQPIIRPESGFRPIAGPVTSTETPIYTTAATPTPSSEFENVRPMEVTPPPEDADLRQNYFQYVVEQPIYKPEVYAPEKSVTLSDLLNSLQLNKSIPKPITRENVGSSIRTLLQVLNALKAMSQEAGPLVSTPTPFVSSAPETVAEVTPKSIEVTSAAPIDDVELQEEPYLAPVNPPSQHLDDLPPNHGGSRQQFPPPVNSDAEGGTPGRPGVDYPVLTNIPTTAFNCKTQRYKGFFADPETRCQVWHYCDLNGGQASFLCPNGTIFSQAALTCDWWFNVRCASATQLYVLNESLYKYILPHSPKFPEDYSGPLVDKYLTLKFKEMEEQFRKNKNKASEKADDDESDSSSEDSGDKESSSDNGRNDESEMRSVSEASVMVESPGSSGNVERLHDP